MKLQAHKLGKLRLIALAALLANAGAMASDDTVFNLVHYQISFGYGGPEQNLYLASNARIGDEFAAHGYSGSIRVPLFSTNPRSWTLFNNDPGNEDRGGGLSWRGVATFIVTVAVVGLSFYGVYDEYKSCREERSAGTCNSDFIAAALTSKQ